VRSAETEERIAAFERIGQDSPLVGVETEAGQFIVSTSDESIGRGLFA
jgi:hypothetical protein